MKSRRDPDGGAMKSRRDPDGGAVTSRRAGDGGALMSRPEPASARPAAARGTMG